MTAILEHAKNLAYSFHSVNTFSIPNRNVSERASPQIIHHYYHDYTYFPGWYWPRSYFPYYPNTTHSCDFSAKEKKGSTSTKKEKKTDDFKWIGLAALVVASAAFYFVGKDLGTLTHTKRSLNDFETEKNLLSDHQKEQVKQVVQIVDEIYQNRKSSALVGLALKSGLAASSVALAAGSFISLPLVLGVGAVGAGLTTAALIVREGYAGSDTKPAELNQKLLKAVKQVEKI